MKLIKFAIFAISTLAAIFIVRLSEMDLNVPSNRILSIITVFILYLFFEKFTEEE